MSEAWIKALRFAALPGAASVCFVKTAKNDAGTVSVTYRLRSFSETDETLGDDRDYDLLKAVMTPLEQLADASGQDHLSLKLNLRTNVLSR